MHLRIGQLDGGVYLSGIVELIGHHAAPDHAMRFHGTSHIQDGGAAADRRVGHTHTGGGVLRVRHDGVDCDIARTAQVRLQLVRLQMPLHIDVGHRSLDRALEVRIAMQHHRQRGAAGLAVCLISCDVQDRVELAQVAQVGVQGEIRHQPLERKCSARGNRAAWAANVQLLNSHQLARTTIGGFHHTAHRHILRRTTAAQTLR